MVFFKESYVVTLARESKTNVDKIRSLKMSDFELRTLWTSCQKLDISLDLAIELKKGRLTSGPNR